MLQLFRKKAVVVLALWLENAADWLLDFQLNDMLPTLSCLSMSMDLEVSVGHAPARHSLWLSRDLDCPQKRIIG